jgi:hypothetical protein
MVLRLFACAAVSAAFAVAAPIVNGMLNASLDTGSLAGNTFAVSFSYDAGQVQPTGQTFVALSSIDFELLGTPFDKSGITQGGQAVFQDGAIFNLTASFQSPMPPGSPVSNITFGFGGPGIIGYIDDNGMFGSGAFTFVPVAAPEPAYSLLTGIVVFCLAGMAATFAGLKARPIKRCE